MAITRKEFLTLSVIAGGAALAGLGGTMLAACGGEPDESPGPRPRPTTGGDAGEPDVSTTDAASDASTADSGTAAPSCRSSIAQNHGHVLVLPFEDLEADTAKTYAIKGSSDHDHEITLEPSHFADLRLGVSVQIRSTPGYSHDHLVSILCS